MKNTFDTDAILYKILAQSDIKNQINGGIYYEGDRPTDSTSEDITINSISLSQDFLPQIGVSNVNIYVSDKKISIKGKERFVADRQRLKTITQKVTDILRSARVDNLLFTLQSQEVTPEINVKQHFTNIRLSWNIQEE